MSVRQVGFVVEKKHQIWHPIEAHNYYAERKIACPYCTMGSKPVPKCLIEGRVRF